MNQLEWYMSQPDDYFVNKHSEKDIFLIKYKHTGIDWSNPWALEARGIVLDGDSNVVARPYKKFFNYMELRHREDLPKETRRLSYWNSDEYTVYEKLDGSLCTVFQYDDEVMFASSGSLESKFPRKFKHWFDKNLSKKNKEALKAITDNYTLLFEYVSPKNRIVVPYQEEDMILHGIINTESGKEITKKVVFDSIAKTIGVDTVKTFGIDKDAVMRIQEQDFGDDILEGFVVRFDSGRRIKIKTEQYVELHSDYTLHFGDVESQRKIQWYIDMIDDNTIDDLIGRLESVGDSHTISVINKVLELDGDFRDMHSKAGEIVSAETFDKKDYALTVGTDAIEDLLVLNYGKQHKVEKFRRDFISNYFIEKRKKEQAEDEGL